MECEVVLTEKSPKKALFHEVMRLRQELSEAHFSNRGLNFSLKSEVKSNSHYLALLSEKQILIKALAKEVSNEFIQKNAQSQPSHDANASRPPSFTRLGGDGQRQI